MLFIVGALASLFLTITSCSSTDSLPHVRNEPEKKGFRAATHYRSHRRKQAGISRRDNGTAQPIADNGQWLISVSIGGQQMTLNILTDTADLWVTSTLLPKNESRTVTTGKLYDPSQSSDYHLMEGYQFSEFYADGSGAAGLVATDTVEIGGAVVRDMPFGVCTDLQYGSGSTSRDTDGPLGLGFGAGSSITPTKQCTFMECLEPYVDQPIFSTAFELDNSGSIDFGYSDDSAYEGDLTVLPIANNTIDNPALWVSQGVHYGSGGKFFRADPTDMQFDTANPYILLPADAASEYFALVKGAAYSSSSGVWTYPCTALPDLDIIFSNVTSGPSTVTIPGSSLKSGNEGSGVCTSWVNNADGLANAGLPFYTSKYMIWNQQVPSISFARRSGVPAPKATVTKTVTSSSHPETTSQHTSTSSSPGLTTSKAHHTPVPKNSGSGSDAARTGMGIGLVVAGSLFIGLWV